MNFLTKWFSLETDPDARRVYKVAYDNLGKHLTLNEAVSPEVGCAEAWSWIMKNCGYTIPQGGITTVAGAEQWMEQNGFVQQQTPAPGYVVTGRSPSDAHIGVWGDFWVMSNTSYDDPAKGLVKGLFQANYHDEIWSDVFPTTHYWKPGPVV